MCVSSKPSGSEMICLRERQTRFSSSICWPKLRAVVDISVASMHARTDEEIYVKVPQGGSDWYEESIKALARVLMRRARDKYAFPTERHQSVHLQKDFVMTWTCWVNTHKSCCSDTLTPVLLLALCVHSHILHGDDFLVCGSTPSLECLADEFKKHFLVKNAETVSLRPEHQKEIHFVKRRVSVDNFGWQVELDQR